METRSLSERGRQKPDEKVKVRDRTRYTDWERLRETERERGRQKRIVVPFCSILYQSCQEFFSIGRFSDKTRDFFSCLRLTPWKFFFRQKSFFWDFFLSNLLHLLRHSSERSNIQPQLIINQPSEWRFPVIREFQQRGRLNRNALSTVDSRQKYFWASKRRYSPNLKSSTSWIEHNGNFYSASFSTLVLISSEDTKDSLMDKRLWNL